MSPSALYDDRFQDELKRIAWCAKDYEKHCTSILVTLRAFEPLEQKKILHYPELVYCFDSLREEAVWLQEFGPGTPSWLEISSNDLVWCSEQAWLAIVKAFSTGRRLLMSLAVGADSLAECIRMSDGTIISSFGPDIEARLQATWFLRKLCGYMTDMIALLVNNNNEINFNITEESWRTILFGTMVVEFYPTLQSLNSLIETSSWKAGKSARYLQRHEQPEFVDIFDGLANLAQAAAHFHEAILRQIESHKKAPTVSEKDKIERPYNFDLFLLFNQGSLDLFYTAKTYMAEKNFQGVEIITLRILNTIQEGSAEADLAENIFAKEMLARASIRNSSWTSFERVIGAASESEMVYCLTEFLKFDPQSALDAHNQKWGLQTLMELLIKDGDEEDILPQTIAKLQSLEEEEHRFQNENQVSQRVGLQTSENADLESGGPGKQENVSNSQINPNTHEHLENAALLRTSTNENNASSRDVEIPSSRDIETQNNQLESSSIGQTENWVIENIKAMETTSPETTQEIVQKLRELGTPLTIKNSHMKTTPQNEAIPEYSESITTAASEDSSTGGQTKSVTGFRGFETQKFNSAYINSSTPPMIAELSADSAVSREGSERVSTAKKTESVTTAASENSSTGQQTRSLTSSQPVKSQKEAYHPNHLQHEDKDQPINYTYQKTKPELIASLIWAIENSNIRTINVYLEEGAILNMIDPETKLTPLNRAIAVSYQPDNDLVRFLISKGADPRMKDGWGKTPLQQAIAWCRISALNALVEVIPTEELADYNYGGENVYEQCTVLGELCVQDVDNEHHRFEMLETYLETKMPEIHQRDGKGQTALMRATSAGRLMAVRLLLRNGAQY